MTFPILGGNGAVAGYSIDNSLRFDESAPSYLSRTPASAGNRKTFTHSTWVKFSGKYGGRGGSLLNANGSSASTNFIYGIDVNTTGNASGSPDHALYIHSYAGDVITTSRLLRDYSSWYHIVLAVDTTQSTATDRIKLYINGELQSYTQGTNFPSQNDDFGINDSRSHDIGSDAGSADYNFGGYMAETYLIDGTALSPTDFGEFDEDSGIWKPIEYTGSYGTNGFYLDFENSGSLGADQSGNGNNFTPTNLASTDQTTDTPTNNFATLNANLPDSGYNTSELSEGNLIYNVSEGNNGNGQPTGNMPVASGKWYWEIKFTSAQNSRAIGLCRADKVSQETVQLGGTSLSQTNATISLNLQDQQIIQKDESGTTTTEGSSLGSISNGDIFGHFLDLDNGTFQFYKNGSAYGSQFALDNLSSWNTYGALPTATGFTYMRWDFNFGNPPFTISSGNSDANGYGNFEYSPNDGTYNYLALCTQNLATALSPTIDDGSAYFQTKTYTGNGVETAITNDGNSNLQPDLIWFKARSAAYYHGWFDSTRGTELRLSSNVSDAEVTKSSAFTSFDSDGFTVGADVSNTTNASGQTFVAWQWKANGGTTSSNTDGSITATLQSNATSGFAIATWSGTGTAGTIGHNLGVAPKLVIVKRRNSPANSWAVQHSDLASDFVTFLNRSDTGGETDSTMFNGTHPTSSVFSVGTHAGTNQSGGTYVGYIFAPITGYSAIGKYTGNGSSTDGTYVHLGFRPSFVMVKAVSRTGDWIMEDANRSTYNPVDDYLRANGDNAEVVGTSSAIIDFTSNGFKCRANGFVINESSASYIYMAFAENPFVTSSGVPVVAR